jgi:glycopeptide antibiotics resistance protein
MIKIVPDMIALLLIYKFVFYDRWKYDQLRLKSILYFYFCGVILVTLMPVIMNLPFIFSHPYVGMNMEPYVDFFLERGDFRRQIFLNILMTIPFGFLYPLIYKKRVGAVVWKGFLISLSIEVVQPLLSQYRSSDITDIINNVLGALVGFLIYKAVSKVFVKKEKNLVKSSS